MTISPSLAGPFPPIKQASMIQWPDGSVTPIPSILQSTTVDDAQLVAEAAAAIISTFPTAKIKLGPWPYTIKSPLVVPAGMHLQGTRGTTILPQFGGAGNNTGAAVYSHGAALGGAEFEGKGAIIENLLIDGIGVPAGTISSGMDIGDDYHITVRDVIIQNFLSTGATNQFQSNPLGAVGFNWNNAVTLTEKLHVRRVIINNCLNGVQVVTTTGASTSHMYSDVKFILNMQPHQNGLVVARQGHLENSEISLWGNMYCDLTASNAALIVLGQGNQAGHSFNCVVDINVEADPTGSGTTQPKTIAYGTNADNTIATWRGRFRCGGGWQAANPANGAWQFSGRLVGDSSLYAATANVANPVSGTVYTNNGPDAVVVVTGGTVSAIIVNGVTTGLTSGVFPLPMNATIQINWTVQPTWNWYSNLAA